MCQIMFYNQLPTSDTIHKLTLAPEVGRFHIGAVTNVEPGHWGRHQCPAMEPMWAGSTSVPSPMWNTGSGADTKFPVMEQMCQNSNHVL